MKNSGCLVVFLLVFLSNFGWADWPQFQGPQRNGVSSESGLLDQWPENGPALVWTFDQAGLGYSSPAIVGDKLLLSGARGDEELLLCVDLNSGKELWSCTIGPKFDFEGNSWGAGPRSTPSVADNRVFALGGRGNFICADLATGKLLWSVQMMKDLGGLVNPIGGGPGSKEGEAKIGWGYSWSPLVDGDRVLCYPGGPEGALALLESSSGKVVWRSEQFTALASYASPIAAEIEGQRQYIALHNGGVTSVSASDGRMLWSWEKLFPDVAIPTPILIDNQLYATACGTCALLNIGKSTGQFAAEMLYKGKATRVMKCQVAGPVIHDGHVYGFSEKVGWVCQNMASGDQLWAARVGNPLKAGSLIVAEGLLYCYDEETGEVALVEALPTKFSLKSKFTLPKATANKPALGRNWTPPVIHKGRLFIRDQELLFCFNIKK